MPRLKVTPEELDIKALEAAEYDEGGDFEPYAGPTPPKKTILTAYVKSMWWTYDANDKRQIIYLVIADGNTGAKAKYNGLPMFERQSLTEKSKWKWAPTMRILGFTLQDVFKKLYVLPEENDHERFGAVIEKIGSFVPGEENENAWVRVVTDHHEYDDTTYHDVGRFMAYEDEATDDADDEEADELEDEELEAEEADEDEAAEDENQEEADEEEDEDQEEEDEDQEEEDEEEEEAPPARPARRDARTSAAPAASSGARSSGTRGAKPAPAKPAPAKSARARRAKGVADDPPF